MKTKLKTSEEVKKLQSEEKKRTVTDDLFDRSVRGKKLFLGLFIFALVGFIGWFQLRVGIWGSYEGQIQIPVHLTAFMIFVFMYPLYKEKKIGIWAFFYNILPAILCVIVIYYYLTHYYAILFRMGIAQPQDYPYGLILIGLVLEAARRTAGLPIVIVAVLFILYSFFGNYLPGPLWTHGFSLSRIIGLHFTTTDGLFSVPLEVTATFLILFIFFGSALQNSGAGDHFLNIANSLVGRFNAGPAKLAVVASALQGTFSGSATANVVGTGSVTIPLMKKLGYKSAFAAAIEASASTGGQIMPPIMGAAAFIMASMLGISYFAVVKAAVIPAVLYFTAVYFMIDLEGRKIGLKPLKEVPPLKDSLAKGFHLVLPIFLLIYLLVAGYSLMRAGFVLFFSVIVLSFLRKDTRITPRIFFNILECGIRDACAVVMICAVAGLIVGSIIVTGLGLKLGAMILTISAGHLWLALIFTMVVALVLGMGMPTVAVYIILCTLLGEGLRNLGTYSLLSAHLFMFWFAVISCITPPVAIAAYAGAAIANSDPWETGLIGFRFALSGFIIPYSFIYGPALLMQGTWTAIIFATITAFMGIFSLSIALEGWLLAPLKHWYERILYIVASIFLIKAGAFTDIIGLLLLISGIALQISRAQKWGVIFRNLD